MDRAEVARSLSTAVRGAVTTSPASLDRFAHDASHVVGDPLAAVRPEDAEDVVQLVRWARAHHVPLVPRGAGTSLDGESVAGPGAVAVDLSGFDTIGEVDEAGRRVVVGPGVVNYTLHRALRPHRLFFPPNPGSWRVSTLGGNVATNASGPRSYLYGPTRAWLEGVDVVLGTGERVSVGRGVRKRSVGPELAGLFAGSEGTLGIFTEVTVRLAPSPERRMGWIVPLPDLRELGRILPGLASAPHPRLAALEVLDERCAREVAKLSNGRLPGGTGALLLELESTTESETGDAELLLDRFRSLGVGSDPVVYPDADDLWTLRGRSSEALDRSVGSRVREDIAVPVARIGALFELIGALAREYDVESFVYGHVGEANLHPNFAIPPGSPAGEALRRKLLTGALELGGTVSGEHGIGTVKRDFVERELGGVAVSLLASWKQRCDPDGILNPGKLFPGALEGGPRPSGSPSGSVDDRTPPK